MTAAATTTTATTTLKQTKSCMVSSRSTKPTTTVCRKNDNVRNYSARTQIDTHPTAATVETYAASTGCKLQKQ